MTNRIDDLMDRCGEDVAALRAELERLDRDSLADEEAEAWFHLRGLVEFREGRREKARGFFEQGVERFPGSCALQFSLGQEYQQVGRIEDAVRCFHQVRLADVGGAMVLAVARYLYLWGQPEEGQQSIQGLFDAFYELEIADDHLLHARGLPFFGEAFGYRAVFALLSGAPTQATHELDRAVKTLSNYDFATLQAELEAFLTGDWEPVLKGLEKFNLKKRARDGSGFFLMQKAVLLSRLADDLKSAHALVDGVRLDEDDFPWLADIRLLARAEAARRFGAGEEEAHLVSAFLERQPLLFEPNHVFRFGFLDYQERLKRMYQDARRG